MSYFSVLLSFITELTIDSESHVVIDTSEQAVAIYFLPVAMLFLMVTPSYNRKPITEPVGFIGTFRRYAITPF